MSVVLLSDKTLDVDVILNQ